MSKSKKALYAKIRNGGYGAQFDFGKIEEEYIGARQTNGCFGCAFYLGEERCSKRERIRKAADEDYGNCDEWIDKPTYKQNLRASSSDDDSSNMSTTKKEKKAVPGDTMVKSWNLLIQEKYLEEDKDTVLPLMLNDKAAQSIINKREALTNELFLRVFLKMYSDYDDYDEMWKDLFEVSNSASIIGRYALLKEANEERLDVLSRQKQFYISKSSVIDFYMPDDRNFFLVSLLDGLGIDLSDLCANGKNTQIRLFDSMLKKGSYGVEDDGIPVYCEGDMGFDDFCKFVETNKNGIVVRFFPEYNYEAEKYWSDISGPYLGAVERLKSKTSYNHRELIFNLYFQHCGPMKDRYFTLTCCIEYMAGFIPFRTDEIVIYDSALTQGKSILDKLLGINV